MRQDVKELVGSGARIINAEVSKAVKQCTFPRMLSMAYQSDSQNNLTAYLKTALS